VHTNLNAMFLKISDGLERKSIALAIRRFSGQHTFDKIAELILEILPEFN